MRSNRGVRGDGSRCSNSSDMSSSNGCGSRISNKSSIDGGSRHSSRNSSSYMSCNRTSLSCISNPVSGRRRCVGYRLLGACCSHRSSHSSSPTNRRSRRSSRCCPWRQPGSRGRLPRGI